MAAMGRLIVWGTPHSLFTGKLRAYLIKKGLPFQERRPFDSRYREVVTAKVRLGVVPVVETPAGEFLQDTTAIIDRLEADHPEPSLTPAHPALRFVAEVFDAYGSAFLLPAAMHYRWTYRDRQEAFLEAEFGRGMYAGADRDAQRAAGRKAMGYFANFLPRLGVTDEAIPAIEASYLGFLELLDLHFQQFPYVLGGRPSLADFGLMGPLFAHLGRDPVPATIMKTCAPNVFRWVERMNAPGFADAEFPGQDDAYIDPAAPPASLEALLRYVFADIAPELAAQTDAFEAWLTAMGNPPAGTPVSTGGKRQVHPQLGPIRFVWRGRTVDKASAAQTLWHVQRAAEVARSSEGPARATLDRLVERTGGQQVRDHAPSCRMVRADYILVLDRRG